MFVPICRPPRTTLKVGMIVYTIKTGQFPTQYPQNQPESTYQNHYIKKVHQLKDLPRVRPNFFEQLKADGRIEIISTQKVYCS